ncbi:hypothetical protein [Candidatus Parabeggiatoa sp. HSG14]|uniref:hypothetical protein n=1 Tax=Candidatus Parabeggiatoa sp. HSG14 TaxID=3055593 RepID=UPI0025A8AB83|nr:hypothetical protein [Thiotrichales bacterium HSG14]
METIQSIHVLQTLDRLINEMKILRSQVVASLENPAAKTISSIQKATSLENSSSKTISSIRETEYFGMWANREDMPEGSSRAWLEQLRSTQWNRSL